jgi:hypothetical protein
VVAAAKQRGCGCSPSAGAARHPPDRDAIDGFRAGARARHAGTDYTCGCRCRRLPGRERAGRGRPRDRDRQRAAAAFAALAQLKGAKGRLELVGERNGAPIFVDYAHKPDALAKALEALRPYVPAASSWCSAAAAIATRQAADDGCDRRANGRIRRVARTTIPGSEDPACDPCLRCLRGQPPARPRSATGAEANSFLDHGPATRVTCLLIAGKGHETGQIVGKQVLPFSDHRGGRRGALAGRWWHDIIAALDRRRR